MFGNSYLVFSHPRAGVAYSAIDSGGGVGGQGSCAAGARQERADGTQ